MTIRALVLLFVGMLLGTGSILWMVYSMGTLPLGSDALRYTIYGGAAGDAIGTILMLVALHVDRRTWRPLSA